jgi:hypothetical protein
MIGVSIFALVITLLILFGNIRTSFNPTSGLTAYQLEQYLSLNSYRDNQLKLHKESQVHFPSDLDLERKWEEFKKTQITVQATQSENGIYYNTLAAMIFVGLIGLHLSILKKQKK